MKFGLVFSGGMAKGAYQIGAYRALEKFLPPDSIGGISAASIGSLNAYACASGNLHLAERIWSELTIHSPRDFLRRIVRSSFLEDTIASVVSPKDTLFCPLYIACYNRDQRCLGYINLQALSCEQRRQYLLASVSLPKFSKPVMIDEHRFCDGAIVDNVPLEPLLNTELDALLVVHFNSHLPLYENTSHPPILSISLFNQEISTKHFTCNRQTVAYMIEKGYQQTAHVLRVSQATDWTKCMPHFSHSGLSLRGDDLVLRMNRLLAPTVPHRTIHTDKASK